MTEDKRIVVIDDVTNKEIEYDNVYLHPEPEDKFISLYNGGRHAYYSAIGKMRLRI